MRKERCGDTLTFDRMTPAATKMILVVEDDTFMSRALERLLKAHGFSVRCFPSAEAFLAIAGGCDAACMLLDIRLGGRSGLELRRDLRACGSTIPVIFITAFDSDSMHRDALEVGCSGYLMKPFEASVLIDAIAVAINSPSGGGEGMKG